MFYLTSLPVAIIHGYRTITFILLLLSQCSTAQHSATQCNTVQTQRNTAQHSATQCKHSATQCNTVQTQCNTVQHSATQCKHSATQCSTVQHSDMDNSRIMVGSSQILRVSERATTERWSSTEETLVRQLFNQLDKFLVRSRLVLRA